MESRKVMSPNKESIEISCSACNARFRLWVPFEMVREWERGVKISCIKCGAEHFVRKGIDGFDVSRLKELTVEPQAAPAPAPVQQPVQAAPPPPPPPPAQPVQVPEIQVPVTQAPAPAPAAPTSSDTVLVVEDDRVAREMVEATVKDLGYRLITVKNATEAINVLRKERINLVVADLYLKNPADPESTLDGEELLKRIIDSGLTIPAIITTGKDIIDDLVLDPKWFEFNVKGFIQKGNPFWVDELKIKVKEILYKD